MKKKLSFSAFALLATLISSAVMAQNKGQRTDPDHAKYNIIGEMVYENETGKRFLKSAEGKNIQFEYIYRRLAHPTQEADLVVRFDSVETSHPGGITRLDFWRYDEEIDEWLYDSEVRQGEKQLESTMKTNIMLVIDNSTSLKGDFKRVQDAAIQFVDRLYRASNGRDIFRVGVIGFSTVQFTKTREIMVLDAKNYREIVSFIRNLEMQNGTALYYSLETALNMLESDATNIGKETYKESHIYAFTDGLDQASVDDSRGLSDPMKFFEHIKPMMKGDSRRKIMDKIVLSKILTVRGDDMTDKQERSFDKRIQDICDEVRKLDDISKLTTEFIQLAEDLISSNYVLYCYIPVGASGRVGWTFAEGKAYERPPRVRIENPSNFWMGLGIEGLYGTFYYHDLDWSGKRYRKIGNHIAIDLRTDMAWNISSSFSLGGTLALGFCNTTGGQHDGTKLAFKIGPLVKFNTSNDAALLTGLGLQMLGDNSYAYITLGVKFKSPLYITFSPWLGDSSKDEWGIGFGIGYSIRGGRKSN